MRLQIVEDALRQALHDKKIDAFLVTQLENIRYLTGFIGYEVGDGILLVTKSSVTFFTDGRYLGTTQDWPKDIEVVDWTNSEKRFDEMKARLKQSARLGFETNASYDFVEKLTTALRGHVTVMGVTGVVERFRIIKTREEIAYLQHAGKIMDDAIATILKQAVVGRTEQDIMTKLNLSLRTMAKSDDLSFPTIVASGPNSAVPHHEAGVRRVQEGDVLLIDFGVRVGGYCGDMTVTLLPKDSTEEMRRVYDLVFEAQQTAIKAARPGMTCGELDAVARDMITHAGYGDFFVHSLGHGVGLETHEDPAVAFRKPYADVVLQEGMCVTIEPGIYLPDKFGVRLEVFGHLTNSGYVSFTNHPFNLAA